MAARKPSKAALAQAAALATAARVERQAAAAASQVLPIAAPRLIRSGLKAFLTTPVGRAAIVAAPVAFLAASAWEGSTEDTNIIRGAFRGALRTYDPTAVVMNRGVVERAFDYFAGEAEKPKDEAGETKQQPEGRWLPRLIQAGVSGVSGVATAAAANVRNNLGRIDVAARQNDLQRRAAERYGMTVLGAEHLDMAAARARHITADYRGASGSRKVAGYTRRDGIHVAGYTRATRTA